MTTSRAVLEKEGVRFDFHDYVPRINEAPYETPVYLVPSSEPPVGVGESGVPRRPRRSPTRYSPRPAGAFASCR